VPKVSDAHLAARRDQILDAAVRSFAVDGFQATSMSDIVRASGMSAGAVYRYYPSKDDLIAAVADRVMAAAAAVVQQLLAEERAPHPAEVVAALVTMADRIASAGEVDVSRVAVQAWAEALRNDRIRAIAATAYGSLRAHLETACRRSMEAGDLPAHLDPAVAAQVLFSLVPGYLLQRLLLGDVSADTYGATLLTVLGARPGAS
jgi:AcrR family transcriptional regulator